MMNQDAAMHARLSGFARVFVLFATVAGAFVSVGCVTEPSARHRDVASPPSDVHATSVQIFAAAPRDTNSNGYGDTISVTMYLFDEQRYPLPIAVSGSVRFDLKSGSGAVIASWGFSREETRRVLQSMAPGPGYRFELSLLDKGGDKLENQEALLTVEFQPESGAPVKSPGGVALRIGRVSQ